MKKILFIIPFIPYPLDSGGNQAFYNMIEFIRRNIDVSIILYPRRSHDKRNVKQLKKLWNNVTFYVFDGNYQAEEEEKHSRYYSILLKAQKSIARKIKRCQFNVTGSMKDENIDIVRAHSTLPNSIYQPLDESYLNYVIDIANKGFDIIQVEFFELIALGYVLPKNVDTVFVHHELRYIHNENELDVFQDKKNIDMLNYRVATDFERAALLQYKHIIALTEVDKLLLSKLLNKEENIYASPAIVQIEQESKKPFKATCNHTLTFVGSENHNPNLDAATWFCKEIAPLLRKKNFKFTFKLIGSWHGKYMTYLQKICPELQLTGFVENLNDAIAGSIAIVPIRIGSGMRMKILDAIQSDTPFVTTSKGCEGLDFCNGQECLIADTPQDFADALIHLADNASLQETMVKNARAKLNTIYQPQEMLNKRMNIYNRILKQ